MVFVEALIVELVLILVLEGLQDALVLLGQSRRSASLSRLQRNNLIWELQFVTEIVIVLGHVKFIVKLTVIIKLLKSEIGLLVLDVVMLSLVQDRRILL